jgi:putative phosphoribosyl transferase
VATRLHTEVGVVVVAKILAPGSEENAIGAIVFGEREYFDAELIEKLGLASDQLALSLERANEELSFRWTLYKDEIQFTSFAGRTVILVDDGAATGSTLIASARYVRKRRPANLIIAIPVAAKRAVKLLESEADQVVTIVEAKDNFRAVGQFYRSFAPSTHDDVLKILKCHPNGS